MHDGKIRSCVCDLSKVECATIIENRHWKKDWGDVVNRKLKYSSLMHLDPLIRCRIDSHYLSGMALTNNYSGFDSTNILTLDLDIT